MIPMREHDEQVIHSINFKVTNTQQNLITDWAEEV